MAGRAAKSELVGSNLNYIIENGDNDAPPTFQEASGAPVEVKSPLGYSVGPMTILFLNISTMVGTGVYSTPSAILAGTGSPGLAIIYWVLGFIISMSMLCVFLEFSSYFPSRSGSSVAYLEQAYPRPKYFVAVAFAMQNVLLTFASSNSIVFSQYMFSISSHKPTDWEMKGVAVACFTVVSLLLIIHTRFSYFLSNGIGIIKVLTLVFIAITGFVVLSGRSSVKDPHQNFRRPFEGKVTPYGATNALVKVIFSYGGFSNAFSVVNETKNPVKANRTYGSASLLITATLYTLANVAYFAAVPKSEIEKSTQITASLFFKKVFGSGAAVKGLDFLIALSAFGQLITANLGHSRMIRECGRQGVLPFPRFWVSTRPFGTPLGPYIWKWVITTIMIVAPPAGDAFNFVVDLQIYPLAFFNFAMTAGLFIVRQRRKKLGIPPSQFRTWDVVVVFNLLVNLYMLVMPWYPPDNGKGDVSFWYATYAVTGIGILLATVVYYYAWMWGIPKLRGYRIRQETIVLDDGAASHELVKVPVAELEKWDAAHDSAGRVLSETASEEGQGSEEKV